MPRPRLGTGSSTRPRFLASRKADALVFGGAVAAFVASYLAYFPKMYQTDDDASYLAQAYALRHGHMTLDSLNQSVVQSFVVDHHLVSQSPPGMPALLAAASLFGWTAAIGVNLVVVLATTALVAYLLRHQQLPTVFAVLYLLYPTTVLFSRTVMSDLLSGLLVAAAFVAVIKKKPVAVGLILGAAVLVRSANALACVTIPAGVIFDMWRQEDSGRRMDAALRWLGGFAAGVAPGAVLAAVAYYVVGGGEYFKYAGTFALRYVPHHLPLLAGVLMLMYPLMLLAPLVARSPVRTPVVLTCYGFLLLYSAWFYESKGSTSAQTVVLSQRFLLVVLPLFVVAYAGALRALAERLRLQRVRPLWREGVAALAAVLLVIGSVIVQRSDQAHTVSLADTRSALLSFVSPHDLLVCDKEVAKLFLPQWGSRDIYIIDTQPASEVRRYIGSWIATKAGSDGRVVVADWANGGLGSSTGGERSATSLVASLFPTVALKETLRGLPSGVQLLLVSASRKP
jgi:hypothetical protein